MNPRALLVFCILVLWPHTFLEQAGGVLELGSALTQAGTCSQKVLEEWFPSVKFKRADMALDRVSVHVQSGIVDIPLIHPKEQIRLLKYYGGNIDSALRFLDLLQAGKIGAVSVRPYGIPLHQALATDLLTTEDIKGCDRRRISDVLGLCDICTIDQLHDMKH